MVASAVDTTCADGKWFNTEIQRCGNCDVKCKTCKPPGDFCTSCGPTKYISFGECEDKCPAPLLGYTAESTCIAKCPEGTWVNEFFCTDCDPTCKTCSESGSICDTCAENEFLYEDKCRSTCPEGLYGIPSD